MAGQNAAGVKKGHSRGGSGSQTMQSGNVTGSFGKKLIGGAHGKKGYHGHNLGSMNQEYLNSLLSPSMLHSSQGGSAMGSYGQPQGGPNVNATRMSHGFP